MSQFENNYPSGNQKRKAFDQDAPRQSASGQNPNSEPTSPRQTGRPKGQTPAGGRPGVPPAPPRPKPGTPPERMAAASSGSVKRQATSTGGKATSGARGGAAAKTKPKKSRVGKVLGIVLLCLVLLLAGVVVFAYNGIKSVIAPENDDHVPEDIKGIPEYTGEGVVHGLICGIDYDNEGADGYDDDEHIGRTDMILYMRYDTINNQASFLQIPRDTFVGPELNTGGTGKINALYYYSDDPNNRIEPLARCIYDQLGLPVDFYITIDMDAVKEIIDHPPGTLRVYVPIDVMDPNDPNAVIPQGWREFTSTEAEFFLRNRKSPTYNDQGDIMRLQMQQSFYSALYREFKQLAPQDLLMWMRVILWRVNTDMDPVQLGGLAQKALNIEGADITFVRPPVGVADYNGNSVLSLEPEGTAEILNTYFRPADQPVDAEDLGIYELPMNVGVSEASVRSMSDIQSVEEPEAA